MNIRPQLMWVLLCCLSVALHAHIIGNVPFNDMRTRARLIVAGTVEVVASGTQSAQWTIRPQRVYQGASTLATITATSRPVSSTELAAVRGRRGIFLLDTNGGLIGRTGSIQLGDLFVPLPPTPAATNDNDAALCVDWLRGLANSDTSIMRDLAVAAADCGRSANLLNAVKAELGSSPRDMDALIVLLVGLSYSDPSAVRGLEPWLNAHPTLSQGMVENVAWSLFSYASPDPAGTLALRQLALSGKYPRIQQAAATVLAYIHSDETWPDLQALLVSPDREVRWLALQGLQQTVQFGEVGPEGKLFGRPLVHLGQRVPRVARKRPPIPETGIVRGSQPLPDDTALIRIWQQYAAQN